jgi:hypothetical protein
MLIAAISLFVSDITVPPSRVLSASLDRISFSGLNAVDLCVLSTPSQQQSFPGPMVNARVTPSATLPWIANYGAALAGYTLLWSTISSKQAFLIITLVDF